MTLQSLARTIAKARHGTDAMWANYMGAAEAARREVVEECVRVAREWEIVQDGGWVAGSVADEMESLIAPPTAT